MFIIMLHKNNNIVLQVAEMYGWHEQKKKISTRMGFEPTRAEHNGLAVHRLNHSATSSGTSGAIASLYKNTYLTYATLLSLH